MRQPLFKTFFFYSLLFLCIATARSQDVNYSLDCWLNGNQLRERMGPTKLLHDMPDVFVVVDIEGKGRFMPAFIERGYKGQEMFIDFQAPKPSLGSKIAVSFYQNKDASNAFWSQVFPTEIGGSVGPKISFKGVAVSLSTDWHVNFAHKDLQLSPPDFLEQAILIYPLTMHYKLYDKNTKVTHGEISLKVD